MENPGRLQSMGSLRVGHDWATSLSLFTFMHSRRKWQPTPVLLPGESQGRGAWWAAVYGVAQSQTRLKRLGSSNSLVLSGITLAGRNQLPCHEDTGHMRTWHRAKAFRQVTIPVRVPLWKRTLLASRAFGWSSPQLTSTLWEILNQDHAAKQLLPNSWLTKTVR